MSDRRGYLEPPRLAAGFLACAPLLLAYELGLWLSDGALERNGAEQTLTLVLSPLGARQAFVRITLLAVLTLCAYVRAREDSVEDERSLERGLRRVPLESTVLALVLGPLVLYLMTFFEGRSVHAFESAAVLDASRAPDLVGALRLVGGAPWEELLFRVLVFGLVYLLVVRVAGFLGVARGVARLGADVAAILLSSVLFAAFHLAAFQSLLARPGEPFEPSVFLWRLLAGLVLAGIFRWRGLGVAAWTHGIFNLALALGAGPAAT